MKPIWIADSGGTKTDWCYLDGKGEALYLTTSSYHPLTLSDETVQTERKFWQERMQSMYAPLYFFGAGCFRPERAEYVRDRLQLIGFSDVHVFSDLHAAGWACLGEGSGWVGILGTGSVLFEWQGGKIERLIGGKGHESGDEGSGYYFGKLVYQAWKTGELSRSDQHWLEQHVDMEQLEREMAQGNGKFALADLSRQTSGSDFARRYHTENIRAFISVYITELHGVVSFVGSYAWNQREILRRECLTAGVEVREIIERPIGRLVERNAHFVE